MSCRQQEQRIIYAFFVGAFILLGIGAVSAEPTSGLLVGMGFGVGVATLILGLRLILFARFVDDLPQTVTKLAQELSTTRTRKDPDAQQPRELSNPVETLTFPKSKLATEELRWPTSIEKKIPTPPAGDAPPRQEDPGAKKGKITSIARQVAQEEHLADTGEESATGADQPEAKRGDMT